jgi:integrating conjugative element protein (TIGR03761 family)
MRCRICGSRCESSTFETQSSKLNDAPGEVQQPMSPQQETDDTPKSKPSPTGQPEKEPQVNPAASRPAALRSAMTMTIQTGQAQRLVTGRKKSDGVQPIIGLMEFAHRLMVIWNAAADDDPYADWTLLLIEQSLTRARTLVREKTQWITSVLDGMEGFEIDIAHSARPITVPLQFANAFGYMGAYLVKEYDTLCCAAYTAQHIGLIDRKHSVSLLNETGRAIRRTFNLPASWRYTGVSRVDLQQASQNAHRAKEAMGEVPDDVIERRTRSRIAPDIRRPGGAHSIQTPKPLERQIETNARDPEPSDAPGDGQSE